MKNKNVLPLLFAMTTTFCAVAQTTNPSPYCQAGFDDETGDHHYISRVKLGTLDNNSGTTQFAAPHYVFYNNVTAPNIATGSNQTLTITHGATQNSGFAHFMGVWIDFNHNNSFEISERVFHARYDDEEIDADPLITNFTVPVNAAAGQTRMRVIIMADDQFTWMDGATDLTPCTAYDGGSYDWGETEDYTVNITNGTASIGELDDQAVSMSPNPVSDLLSIAMPTEANPEITVTDLVGKTYAVSHSTRENKVLVDFSELPSGIYFVSVRNNGQSSTQKIVKN
jgi:hypothetical protein